jgi:uncharacterized protein (UPF0332 family)
MTDVPAASAEAELALAKQTLEAARLLAREGFHRDAVTRAYYAVFHAACALLASIGRTARTHEGLRRVVNEHFVRPGLLAAEHARALRQIAGERSDADYDASAIFSEEESRADIASAEAFVAAVEALLGQDGAPPVRALL